MKITQTLSSGKNLACLKDEIGYLDLKEIHGLRFNLCKFQAIDWPEVLDNIENALSGRRERFEIAFDLPYPKNKARIRHIFVEGGKIQSGVEYKLIKETYADLFIDSHSIVIDDHEFSLALQEGSSVYFGDGEGEFEIIGIHEHYMRVRGCNDFRIFENKGMSCGFVSDTEKCFEVVRTIHNIFGSDVILMLSFLEKAEEIKKIKALFHGSTIHIIPKIELIQDVNCIPEIVSLSQGALLARGDLGILYPMNQMLNICEVVSKNVRDEKKRLYAATDILNSLEYRSFPSRSDIMDLCMLREMGCTDVVLSYKISKKLDDIIKYIAFFK